MSNNLVALALQYLTPDIINRIAAALGLDRAIVEKLVSAAVPSLFGALASSAANPGGAGQITDAMKGIDPNILSGLANAFTGGKQNAMLDTGKSLLGTALGNRSTATLTEVLGKFGHVDPGAASGLLAAVAPAVLGTIKSNASGLDAGKLSSLLAGQKDNIAAALPGGLSSLLAGSGLMDGINNAARGAQQASTQAGHAAAKTAQQSTASMSKLVWIIPLIAIAALAWYFFGQQGMKPTVPPVPPVPEVVQVDGVDLSKEVTAITDSLKGALGSITDAASAQTALPKLTEITAQVDKLTELVGKLGPDQKKIVAGLLATVLPALIELSNKVVALPGVGDIIKPTVDGLRAKLEALAKA